jgi:SAM-dependent methyltransferase
MTTSATTPMAGPVSASVKQAEPTTEYHPPSAWALMLHHLRLGHTKNFLILGLHDHYLAAAAPLLSGRMIDIGCGHKPYLDLCRPFVAAHIGLDLPDTRYDRAKVDLFGSACAISAPDGSFDSALCTSNLEHVEDPAAAVRECARVLRPGGVAVYTVPFFWHLHDETRDFYRFTPHSLRLLFANAGFEVIRLQPMSGFWATFGQMLVYYLFRFNRPWIRWTRLIDLVGITIQFGAFGLDRISRAEKWSCLYLVAARKK